LKKLIATIALGLMVVFTAVGCNEADTVSHNISQEADKFNVLRRVVFYNGITEGYMLSIEGYCSLGNDRTAVEISITCETSPGEFKKHFLGLSDNVTYFIEQLDGANVSRDHYKVVFKPSLIVPDIEIR
jgi:hypothetical protein